ncbi:MAG: Mov34/MPN/PAD-1 family protein [Candidatus Lokiarchaeota archaeon]|jgi:proteasome lid subunit RPN8/RPN11
MIKDIELQYKKIIEHFPNITVIDNTISHIKMELDRGIRLDINYSKYPKRPKFVLINANGKVYKNLNKEIISLKNWKQDKTKSILNIIYEIKSIIEILQSKIVKIKKELLDGFLALCREHHPNEFLGILKMQNYIFTEYILPPGSITSRNSSVFFPARVPLNQHYQGTIHSHPSGNLRPSLQDLNNVFKRNGFNFIVGFPYSLKNIKCYDKNGIELHFKVIKKEIK